MSFPDFGPNSKIISEFKMADTNINKAIKPTINFHLDIRKCKANSTVSVQIMHAAGEATIPNHGVVGKFAFCDGIFLD